ncbi:hypothetical protein ACFZB5_13870 [Streptomyces nodosus]|uniref:hypothetical protein n=1 Tax=Streptomyces nodosus TaxID=40318 RepID=UPI0036EA440C
MTAIRADVAELLHAGYGDRTIARRLGVPWRAVTAARTVLGIPGGRPGPKPAGSVEDLFWRRTQPTDDGHRLWTSYRSEGLPILKHDGRRYSAYRIAFRIRHGRDPVGQARPGCDREGCVHPRCMEDQTMRDQYNNIFGGAK